MSHFSVIVIGNNAEQQLAPYDENLAVETVDEDGEIYTRNPDAKWDWYEIGGRWTGYFKLKPGALGTVGCPGILTPPARHSYADVAKKGDIDFDTMRDEAEARCRETLTKVRTALNGITSWTPWKQMCDEVHKNDIDAACTAYDAQLAVTALRALDPGLFADLDHYMRSDADLIAEARASAISSFAVVKDSKWYERGEMGWWGCTSNEKSVADWNAEFSKLLDELPDDTLLTAVDCHI